MPAYKAKTWDGSQWVDIGSNSIDSSTFASKSYLASTVPGKNLLHNGEFRIHQRNTSVASITTTGFYTADRWNIYLTTLGTWTQSIENDGPTGSGFRKSLKMLCTAADASPADADELVLAQAIEGQNLQSIRKGTASALPLTLSFWVKSNKTGNYVARIYDGDNARGVSAAYTVYASGVWEQKTVTFPADTTGVLDNDANASFTFVFHLGNGSNFTSGTLGTTWQPYAVANTGVGQVNLASDVNNYWQITGVQLETGSTASAYQFKQYDEELRTCQRYFQRWYHPPLTGVVTGTTSMSRMHMPLPVSMRTTPNTPTLNGTLNVWNGGGVYTLSNTVGTNFTTSTVLEMDLNLASGSYTASQPVLIYQNGNTGWVDISADL